MRIEDDDEATNERMAVGQMRARAQSHVKACKRDGRLD